MQDLSLVRELTFEIEDTAGASAALLRKIADKSVSVIGVLGYATKGKGYVHVAVEATTDLQAMLGGDAPTCLHDEIVVGMRLPNETGAAALALERIASAGINVKHLYATSPGGDVLVVLNTDDNDAVMAALG